MCKEKEKLIKETVTSAFGNRAQGVSMSPKQILLLNDPKPVGLDWIEIDDAYNIRKLVISLKEYERIAKLLVRGKSTAPFTFESEL